MRKHITPNSHSHNESRACPRCSDLTILRELTPFSSQLKSKDLIWSLQKNSQPQPREGSKPASTYPVMCSQETIKVMIAKQEVRGQGYIFDHAGGRCWCNARENRRHLASSFPEALAGGLPQKQHGTTLLGPIPSSSQGDGGINTILQGQASEQVCL